MFSVQHEVNDFRAVLLEVNRIEHCFLQVETIDWLSLIKFIQENIGKEFSELFVIFVKFKQDSYVPNSYFVDILCYLFFHSCF